MHEEEYIYAKEIEFDGSTFAVIAWGEDSLKAPDSWHVQGISGTFAEFVEKQAFQRGIRDGCQYKGISSDPFVPYPWPRGLEEAAEGTVIMFSVSLGP